MSLPPQKMPSCHYMSMCAKAFGVKQGCAGAVVIVPGQEVNALSSENKAGASTFPFCSILPPQQALSKAALLTQIFCLIKEGRGLLHALWQCQSTRQRRY